MGVIWESFWESFGSHFRSHLRGYEGGYTPLHILSNDSQMTTVLSIGRSMGESPYWPHLIGRSMVGESLSYFEALGGGIWALNIGRSMVRFKPIHTTARLGFLGFPQHWP